MEQQASEESVTEDRVLRLGIIGCGAIAHLHADAILKTEGVELSCLVDADEARARDLAALFRVNCPVLKDYREAVGRMEAAIVALPHHLHGKVNLDLLGAGIHVLCEKPLATSIEEAESCVAQAGEKKMTLGVGMIRRFHWTTALMRLLMSSGQLGSLERFEQVDGAAHSWPSATPFYFSRELAGGGIFTTMGVHLLDSLLAWFDDLEAAGYADDNFGGIEADACARLLGRVGSEIVPGTLRCTNLYDLRSHFTVFGSKGSATIHGDNTVSIEVRGAVAGRELAWWVKDPQAPEVLPPDYVYFQAQIRDFAEAVRTGRPPRADGPTAVRVLRIIDQCYGMASRLEQPWMELALFPEGEVA
jgi:predicted dehydrogenase